jgi:hypothetical protein
MFVAHVCCCCTSECSDYWLARFLIIVPASSLVSTLSGLSTAVSSSTARRRLGGRTVFLVGLEDDELHWAAAGCCPPSLPARTERRSLHPRVHPRLSACGALESATACHQPRTHARATHCDGPAACPPPSCLRVRCAGGSPLSRPTSPRRHPPDSRTYSLHCLAQCQTGAQVITDQLADPINTRKAESPTQPPRRRATLPDPGGRDTTGDGPRPPNGA